MRTRKSSTSVTEYNDLKEALGIFGKLKRGKNIEDFDLEYKDDIVYK